MVAGRPTELDEVLTAKIKDLVLEGKSMKEMCVILDIPYDTMVGWKVRNYNDFATAYLTFIHERKLNKAEAKIEQLIESEDEKVALNASTFIAETLGRKHYSKRTETDVTTKGEKLPDSSDIDLDALAIAMASKLKEEKI